MSAELQLIARPAATYARLAQSPARIGPLRALRRPLIVAVVIGVSTAIAATRHAPPALVLSTTLCWSTLVAAQMVIAIVVIAGPARAAKVGVPRALDLFFASHAPWSLWMLAVVVWAPTPGGRSLLAVGLAALVPLVVTIRMIAAHFQFVLGLERGAAMRRTMVHQAVSWLLWLTLCGAAVSLYPRILERVG